MLCYTMHSADYAVARCLSVRLSVCLAVSHTGILSKQLNTSSNFISLRVATPFQFFNTKRHGNNIIILHTLVKLVKSHYCLFVCTLQYYFVLLLFMLPFVLNNKDLQYLGNDTRKSHNYCQDRGAALPFI